MAIVYQTPCSGAPPAARRGSGPAGGPQRVEDAVDPAGQSFPARGSEDQQGDRCQGVVADAEVLEISVVAHDEERDLLQGEDLHETSQEAVEIFEGARGRLEVLRMAGIIGEKVVEHGEVRLRSPPR